jgi:hypothetical protein
MGSDGGAPEGALRLALFKTLLRPRPPPDWGIFPKTKSPRPVFAARAQFSVLAMMKLCQ